MFELYHAICDSTGDGKRVSAEDLVQLAKKIRIADYARLTKPLWGLLQANIINSNELDDKGRYETKEKEKEKEGDDEKGDKERTTRRRVTRRRARKRGATKRTTKRRTTKRTPTKRKARKRGRGAGGIWSPSRVWRDVPYRKAHVQSMRERERSSHDSYIYLPSVM